MPKNSKNTLFISYADQDIEAAQNIAAKLKQQGIDTFLAEDALLPGQNREVVIRRAIRESRFFLVLLSSASVTRGVVNKQLVQALDLIDELPETDIFIIPARLDDCQPSHEKLRALQMVDLFPDPQKGLAKIMQTVKHSSTEEIQPHQSEANANETKQSPRTSTTDPNAMDAGTAAPPLWPSFLTLAILIGAIVGAGYVSRKPLFTLLERYSAAFGTFAIYAGFVILSLIAAVVLFGVMRSSGMFKKSGKQGQYEFGGAMAGFLVTLIFLITSFSTHTATPSSLIISGHVRYVNNGRVIGPVDNAQISVAGVSGFKTETDKDGNFDLKLPSDLKVPQIEIQVVHSDTAPTQYQKISLAETTSVIIEVPNSGDNQASETDQIKKSGNVQTHGNQSPAVVSGGDVNINYGEKGATQ